MIAATLFVEMQYVDLAIDNLTSRCVVATQIHQKDPGAWRVWHAGHVKVYDLISGCL